MEALAVTHPSADALKAFALGKVDDAAAAAVSRHLDACADCRRDFGALSADEFHTRPRDAHKRSAAPASAQTLAPAGRPAPPSAGAVAVPNLPPELAGSPQYEVLRELGRGGMGVVYLARNKLMDRPEVLKVVNKALLDRPGAAERFLREIRSAAKLSHPNVVRAYSALQLGELVVFAMEYIEGEDLAKVVAARGPLPTANACYYAQQAALGLQHAFEKGMVHRDIKPQNLILTREGKKHMVKILDFGLAKATREKGEEMGLTGDGKMLGTPDYVAPEQTLDAANADIRADIYSLGCTLYFLLTGGPPFKGKSLYEVLQAHHSSEAPPLNQVRPDAPEGLAAVVRKMMAKDPAWRYETPIAAAKALGAFVGQGAKGAPPKPAPEPPPAGAWDTLAAGRHVTRLPKAKAAGKRRPWAAKPVPWKRWLIGGVVAAGLLLLCLGGLWAAGVFHVKTAEGPNPDDPALDAAADDPIGEKLEQGKSDYDDAVEKYQKKVHDALDKAEDAARTAGDKDRVDKLKADRDAFNANGDLPKSIPTRDYKVELDAARASMNRAYAAAIAGYTKANMDDKAAAVADERKLFQDAHPTDVFQAGSVWVNDARGMKLTVIERKGEIFRARFLLGDEIDREITTGTVKGRKVSWLPKDVRAIKGEPAGGRYHEGIITRDKDGDVVNFVWRDDKGGSGAYTLRLRTGK